jgi:hypothetical protein
VPPQPRQQLARHSTPPPYSIAVAGWLPRARVSPTGDERGPVGLTGQFGYRGATHEPKHSARVHRAFALTVDATTSRRVLRKLLDGDDDGVGQGNGHTVRSG